MIPDYALIDYAIKGSKDLLEAISPEDRYDLRQDLRQELALKLCRGMLASDLATAARNLIRDHLRDATRARLLEQEWATGLGKRYRVGPNWGPDWYAPHAKAEHYCPFACEGARLMHVKGSSHSSGGDDDL